MLRAAADLHHSESDPPFLMQIRVKSLLSAQLTKESKNGFRQIQGGRQHCIHKICQYPDCLAHIFPIEQRIYRQNIFV